MLSVRYLRSPQEENSIVAQQTQLAPELVNFRQPAIWLRKWVRDESILLFFHQAQCKFTENGWAVKWRTETGGLEVRRGANYALRQNELQ